MPRMTYTQLLDENIRLRQHIDVLERTVGPLVSDRKLQAVVDAVDRDLRDERREEERDLFGDNADD